MNENTKEVRNPYVGLRPYRSDESILFFGQEDQCKRLLNRLYHSKFVAVVGRSGSGKSSLIQAGLIPQLKAGFLNKNDHWYIASSRPGAAPMYFLAESLVKTFDLNVSSEQLNHELLTEGEEKLLDRIKDQLDTGNLLILIDQFEEIFTHANEKLTEEELKKNYSSNIARIEFIKLLISLNKSTLPVYIIITMRSDFIGHCNVFYGLPELLSESQFLVPRLANSNLVKVIEGPAKLFGAKIERSLTNHILNNLKEGEDQLPILEHALNRLWENRNVENNTISLENYSSIGGVDGAISKHARAIYDELKDENKKYECICVEIFKYLTDFGGDRNEGVRKVRKVKELMAISGATFEEVRHVFLKFSAENTCFLYAKDSPDITEESDIEISHESLMRNWGDFKIWRKEEEEDRENLLDLNKRVSDNDGVINWRRAIRLSTWHKYVAFVKGGERERSKFWAARYDVDLEQVVGFLNESVKSAKRRKTLIKVVFPSISIAFLALVIGLLWSRLDLTDRQLKNNSLELKAQELENEKLIAEAALKIYSKSSSELQITLDSLVLETNKMREDNSSLNRENSRLNRQLNQYIEQSRSTKESNLIEIGNLNEQLKDLSNQLSLAEKSKNDLIYEFGISKKNYQTTIGTYIDSLTKLKQSSKNAQTDFDSKISTSQDIVKDLTDQLRGVRAKNSNLTTQIAAFFEGNERYINGGTVLKLASGTDIKIVLSWYNDLKTVAKVDNESMSNFLYLVREGVAADRFLVVVLNEESGYYDRAKLQFETSHGFGINGLENSEPIVYNYNAPNHD